MRKILIRVVFAIAVGLALFSAPAASAAPKVPQGCDVFNNTHCHCLSVRGALNCLTID